MRLTLTEKIALASWILCGLSLECCFESKANMAYTVITAAVFTVCAVRIYGKEKKLNENHS